LEALVESKIYREDELETELERYKTLAAQTPTTDSFSVPRSNGASLKNGTSHHEEEDGETSCEMCGETGHDLDSCPDCEQPSLSLSPLDTRTDCIDLAFVSPRLLFTNETSLANFALSLRLVLPLSHNFNPQHSSER